MDILVVAQYFGDIEELDKSNNRFVYLSALLAKNNRVEVLTTSFIHSKKKHMLDIPNEYNGYKITALKEPGYKKNVSIKRFYSHWILSKNISKYLDFRKKPDVIYCAVPSLDCAYVVSKYAKKNKVRLIIDIQDLWPEAFKMVLNIPGISDLIYYPMTKKADCIYSSADHVISVSNTYCTRAKMVNSKANFDSIYLGTNFDTFDKNVEKNKVDKENSNFVMGYCGTLGHSYDLKCVFDALSIVKTKGIDSIDFWVLGDGPLKSEFENYAKNLDLNVKFYGRVPYYKMCGILSSCDICINPIKKGSAGSIINKHADYAASGVPVINTQECQEYRDLITKYKCGINCECGNSIEVADAIITLYSKELLRKEMGKNHRLMGEEHFNRKITYGKIVKIIKERDAII